MSAFPTLLCFAGDASDEPVHRFEKKEATHRRLDTFVSKCALRKPVLKKPSAKEEL